MKLINTRRQGDVYIFEMSGLPAMESADQLIPRDLRGGLVLAKGESSHQHAIYDDGAVMYKPKLPESITGLLTQEAVTADSIVGVLEVTKDEPVALIHEEHDPIALPTGRHLIAIQAEYSPEGARRVAD